jgi:hypothetical protein
MVQASRNPILERLTNLSVRFFPNSAGSPGRAEQIENNGSILNP